MKFEKEYLENENCLLGLDLSYTIASLGNFSKTLVNHSDLN